MLLVLSAFLTNMVLAQDMEKVSKEMFKKLLLEVGKNKDGKISKSEHMPIWKDKKKGEQNFKQFDRNGDGFITEAEYVKTTTEFSKEKKPTNK